MKTIIGIDEVGRGPWAGPVVSAAVACTTKSVWIEGVKDSKLLNKKIRLQLATQIKQQARGIGIGWVTAAEIDRRGLTEAIRLSMLRAINELSCAIDEVIIDGNINYLAKTHPSKAIIKADRDYHCVAAASIIAKVARDNYMHSMARLYPDYGFERHVGYGTREHRVSLATSGISPLHRKSFAPIARQLDLAT